MQILVVADHAWINGGQSKVAIESALGLAGRGRRVTYLAAVGPPDPRLALAGVEVVCLGQYDIHTAPSTLGFVPQYMWNRQAAAALRGLLAEMDPADSVVHVHAFAKAISPSIGAALLETKIPVLYTMHEFFLVCPNGGFYDYRKAEPCLRTPVSMSCIACNCDSRSYAHKLLRVARQGLIAYGGLRKAMRHVIMISDLQQQASQPYMPPDTVYYRVSNPIDIADPGPKTAPGDRFVFVGRISREKGVEHFCEAAALAGVEPVIAGDGPMLGELKARYPGATFLGWQSPQDVLALLRSARALVFPSVWYEGQPLTVYEALAMGTPVIVSDQCAGREAVSHGGNGLWFRSANASSLADALRSVASDDVCAAMSEAAYNNYWSSPLTLDRHLDAIEVIYRELTGKPDERDRVPRAA